MTIETLKREVQILLAEANDKIRRAEETLADGAATERVHAAGQLVYLKLQRDALMARTQDLEKQPDGVTSATLQWVKEDWMILMQHLQSWIEGA